MTVPPPSVIWWRARMALICVIHSSVAAWYSAASVRASARWRSSQPGKPPAVSSALTYGPMRAMT
jgi:hypothetical protein